VRIQRNKCNNQLPKSHIYAVHNVVIPGDGCNTVTGCSYILSAKDQPKFGFGAAYNNLNCLDKFHFQPNTDMTFSKIQQRFGFGCKSFVVSAYC